MLRYLSKFAFTSVIVVILFLFFFSCNENDGYIDRSVTVKENFFRQYVKANVVGGNKATVVNSKEELKQYVGDLAESDPILKGINFSNSTFIFDSDTLIYVIPTNLPNVINSYIMRGLSGNYAFSYSIETQKAETDDPEEDRIKNAKRDFIIGVVVDKMPADAEIYLDKSFNFIDSTIIGYPSKIEKIKKYK